MCDLIYVALCCGSISFTLTTTSMFKSWREWMSKFHPKLDELVHCPWCLGHWITGIIIVLIDLDPHGHIILLDMFTNRGMNLLFTIFVVVGIQAPFYYIVLRAFEPVGRYLAQRKIDELRRRKDV